MPVHDDSFINYEDLYSAPSRLYYSEALRTLERLKGRVLRLEKNLSERILGSNRCDKGSPFHTEGPTTENARAWVVEVHVRAKETKSNPCSYMSGVNCDLWCPGCTGQQRSRR